MVVYNELLFYEILVLAAVLIRLVNGVAHGLVALLELLNGDREVLNLLRIEEVLARHEFRLLPQLVDFPLLVFNLINAEGVLENARLLRLVDLAGS